MSSRNAPSPHPQGQRFNYETATARNARVDEDDFLPPPDDEIPEFASPGSPRYIEEEESSSEDETKVYSPRGRRARLGLLGPGVRSVDFAARPHFLEEKRPDYNPDAKARPILARKHVPGMPTIINECVSTVMGLTQEEIKTVRQRLRVGEELLQFSKASGPRRRMVRITEDGCDIKYVDVAVSSFKKRSSLIGKAWSGVVRKQRPLAEVHSLVYGRCPVMVRGEHDAFLTFSIRFHTDKWNVLKTVHFGCADDEQLIRWFMGLQMLVPFTKWHISKARLAWLRIKLKLRTLAIRQHIQPEALLATLVEEARRNAFELRLRDIRARSVANRGKSQDVIAREGSGQFVRDAYPHEQDSSLPPVPLVVGGATSTLDAI